MIIKCTFKSNNVFNFNRNLTKSDISDIQFALELLFKGNINTLDHFFIQHTFFIKTMKFLILIIFFVKGIN